LFFVGYGKRVLLARLPFEKVYHGMDGVGLEFLVFEF
jgi:hypothetical protein